MPKIIDLNKELCYPFLREVATTTIFGVAPKRGEKRMVFVHWFQVHWNTVMILVMCYFLCCGFESLVCISCFPFLFWSFSPRCLTLHFLSFPTIVIAPPDYSHLLLINLHHVFPLVFVSCCASPCGLLSVSYHCVSGLCLFARWILLLHLCCYLPALNDSWFWPFDCTWVQTPLVQCFTARHAQLHAHNSSCAQLWEVRPDLCIALRTTSTLHVDC